jgi:hypothetical protein
VSKTSERRFVGLRRSRSCGSIGFRLTAIELAHDIGANRPRGDLGGLRLLALPVRLLVNRADERAFESVSWVRLRDPYSGAKYPRFGHCCAAVVQLPGKICSALHHTSDRDRRRSARLKPTTCCLNGSTKDAHPRRQNPCVPVTFLKLLCLPEGPSKGACIRNTYEDIR